MAIAQSRVVRAGDLVFEDAPLLGALSRPILGLDWAERHFISGAVQENTGVAFVTLALQEENTGDVV